MKTSKILLLTSVMVGPLLTVGQEQNYNIQNFRSYDKNGMNVYESPKKDEMQFDGLKVRVGGNFALQFQALEHENKADSFVNMGINENELVEIGSGFNLATANLNLDVQLADGIRMNMVTFLSSRHHPEAWVKGGYLQIDKLTFLNNETVDNIMQYLTIKAGHMEINYGDAHFRRTDNGNAMYNPLVGNYIMDAFTTEIGGELYFRHNGILAMAGASGGEIKGMVTNPDTRKPSFYGKLGYDNQLNDDFRLRLTGSLYTTAGSVSNTLYGGDRAGSRYYSVMENSLTANSGFTSGRFNPGFKNKVTAFVVNPFIKFKGLEMFGVYEQATGSASSETEDRTWTQIGGELTYRFLKEERMFLTGRYNTAEGPLSGSTDVVSIERIQGGLGCFITDNILTKVEYVTQQYKDFPTTSILHQGLFSGVMVEAVIGF